MKSLRVVILTALTCAAAFAQSASVSQISGTVQDPGGLFVPGAQVTATQTETGLVRTTQSAADGAYLLPSLPIGPYRLEVRKEGFTTYVQSGIILQVNTNPAIDVSLKVGSVSEQVVVEAAAAMVETHSTGVGQVVDQQRVVDLPLNGRQVTQLITLAGLATTVPLSNVGQIYSGKNYPNEAPISVAGGGFNNGLTYLMDGGTFNDPINNLNLPLPFPDGLQEFKVETSALPAQYGHHSAGAVNAVTKSGTNEYHGDAFEFVRNGYFNARDFFSATRDSLKRNQFGGTFGGPILKNKLFFFLGYQGTIQRSAPTTGFSYIPTAAMLSGDFSAITAPPCSSAQVNLKDPRDSTGKTFFPGNQVPTSLFAPPAVKMTSFYGATADPCGQVQFGSLNSFSEQQGLGRFDYQWNSKHTLFGRYFVSHSFAPPSYTGTPLSITQPSPNDQVTSAVFGDTYIINAGMINSFHGVFNRSAIIKTQVPFFGAADLGVQGIYETIPKYLLVTVTGALYSAAGATYPGALFTNTHQISDDVGLIKGNHQFQFGGNYIRPVHNIWINLNAAGAFTFNGQSTGLPMADFLLGKAATFSQINTTQDFEREHYIALYAQDSWKMTPRLSLNYGIRWEPYLGSVIQHGWVSHFDQNAFNQNIHSTVFPNSPAGTLYPGDAGYDIGNRPSGSRFNQFAPRLGLVWDPKGDGRTTVRASWGIFYDLPSTLFYYQYSNEPPWGEAITINNPVGGFVNPWQGYPGGNPFPVSITKNFVFPTGGSYTTVPLNAKPPYLEQWNLSFQKQIGTNWMVSANYIGNNTIHAWAPQALNPSVYIPGASCVINGQTFTPCSSTGNVTQRRLLTIENPSQGPYYNSLATLDYGGTASYNALLVSAQHRMANHFTILANYTWSHCIADLLTTLLAGSYTDPTDRRFDRGSCAGTDIRHNVNISILAQTPKFSERVVQAIAGDWQMSVIASAHSGLPFSATTGIDNDLNGVGGDRSNQLLPDVYCANKSIDCWLNKSAFGSATATTGVRSNMGPYTLRGPNYFGIDLGLSRSIRIREKQRVELRAEAFNIQNRANFLTNSPTNPAAPATGGQNGTSFGKLLYDASPRIMQFAVKYVF
jgi:hypothetical protein